MRGSTIFVEQGKSEKGWQRNVTTVAHSLGAHAGRMGLIWGSGDKLVNPDPTGIFRGGSAASFLNVLRLSVCGFRRHLMEIRLRG